MQHKVLEEIPSHARGTSSGRVKNKAPAGVQITAEQLLREAWERRDAPAPKLPKQYIRDEEELAEYQRKERETYETRIVRNRAHAPLWQRYARWEESQGEWQRARSIWERAIDNDYRNPAIWLGYAEMEMRGRFVNHARNVWDRAVALLPRVDVLWMKYAHMEEILGERELARLVYWRWMEWRPDEKGYFAFIRFELRAGEVDKARGVYEKLVQDWGTGEVYVKYAKFEERLGEYGRARGVFERGSEVVGVGEAFYLAFGKFEERRGEAERARVIYKFAEGMGEAIKRELVRLERKVGGEGLEQVLRDRKRGELRRMIELDGFNYDAWFDLALLEEGGDEEKLQTVYEEAVKNIPTVKSKAAWRKYVYLWISYAVWWETAKRESARDIYKRCLNTIPDGHKKFSFSKVWLLYAQAHLRAGDVSAARKALGAGIGVLPKKERLYRAYIELEMALGEVSRARKVYQTWLEREPYRGDVWLQFAEMEGELGEGKRTVALLRLASEVDGVSRRHEIWEALVQAAKEGGDEKEALEEYVKACGDGRAWRFYVEQLTDDGREDEIRKGFERATRALRERVVDMKEGGREEVKSVLDMWAAWEERVGGDVPRVRELMPERVEQRMGTETLLAAAREWKIAASY